MARWFEFDPGPSIKVPEREHDDRPGMAFALWFVGIAALLAAVISLFARAWSVAGMALAVVFACSVLVPVLLPKSKPPK
jgi:hypothetical protein